MALEQRIIDPEKEAAELNRRITELENLLLETENFRKKQFLISASSVLIILLILISFAIGMIGYFMSYPKKELMGELTRNIKLSYTPAELREMGKGFQSRFLSTFRREAQNSFLHEIPSLRREFKHEFKKTILHTDSNFKKRLEQLLKHRLDLHKQELLDRYASHRNIPRRELEKAIDSANETLIRSILQRFTEQTAPTLTRLNDLNADLEMFRTLPDYTALANEPRDFLESRLYENILEYTVYLLNESKGVSGNREAAE